MKSIIEQLSTYKSVHLNIHNIKTHFVGVPLIIWSIAVLMTNLQFQINAFDINEPITLTVLFSIAVLCYYILLSIPLAIMALIFFGPLIYSANLMANIEGNILISIVVFIIGWIIQFIGHAFEKAKPAFIDDLNQLLIGPLFLLAEIYFFCGFGKNMAEKVLKEATQKRKQFEEKKLNL